MKKLVLTALVLAVTASAAQAHTAFMKPAAFYATGGNVNVEAAYATQFFTPSIGLNTPGFQVIGPDGRASGFLNMAVTAEDSNLQASVVARGTYRVTTGEIVGAVSTLVADGNGSWRPLAAGETPPEGAQTTTLQTVALAESYITQGVANRTAVDANIGRLAIHPITHPNQVLVTTGLEVQLLLDGQPFPNMPFVLYDSGDPETKQDRVFVTNAEGHATLTVDHPGTYVVAIRYRGPAPADSGVAVRSYVTTLTFEARTELPPAPPPEREQTNRPRRDHSRLY